MDVSCFVVYYVFVVVVFSGYLYAHISYLDDNCPACLLLLSTDRDAFFELAETRLKTVEVSCISLRNWMFASSSQFLVSSFGANKRKTQIRAECRHILGGFR